MKMEWQQELSVTCLFTPRPTSENRRISLSSEWWSRWQARDPLCVITLRIIMTVSLLAASHHSNRWKETTFGFESCWCNSGLAFVLVRQRIRIPTMYIFHWNGHLSQSSNSFFWSRDGTTRTRALAHTLETHSLENYLTTPDAPISRMTIKEQKKNIQERLIPKLKLKKKLYWITLVLFLFRLAVVGTFSEAFRLPIRFPIQFFQPRHSCYCIEPSAQHQLNKEECPIFRPCIEHESRSCLDLIGIFFVLFAISTRFDNFSTRRVFQLKHSVSIL